MMGNDVERVARATGNYSEEAWAALVASPHPLNEVTVLNARAIARNILALPELASLSSNTDEVTEAMIEAGRETLIELEDAEPTALARAIYLAMRSAR